MALSSSRRAEKVTTSLRSMNSSSASAMMRFLSSEGWNEKSKPARVLIVERRHHQCDLDAAVLTQRQLFGEQRVDGFDSSQLAVFEAAHGDVEDLDRPWHFQADQGLFDTIDE